MPGWLALMGASFGEQLLHGGFRPPYSESVWLFKLVAVTAAPMARVATDPPASPFLALLTWPLGRRRTVPFPFISLKGTGTAPSKRRVPGEFHPTSRWLVSLEKWDKMAVFTVDLRHFASFFDEGGQRNSS
jgi:hypothetical protein